MFKKILKRFRKELLLAAALTVGLVALLARFNSLGLGVIIGGALVYFYWQYKERSLTDVEQLKRELENSRKEIEQLRHKQFQLAGIRPIMEVGLMEVDTHFTRTWNEKLSKDNRDLHFIGALQIRLKAKYGINLKDLTVRMDHANKIIEVGHLHPRFLSFSDVNHEWKIAEMLEYKKRPWILDNYWRKSEQYQSELHRIMEEKRKAIYDEIKQGPEEIQWLMQPLYQQVENTLRILLNRTDYDIHFVEEGGRDFVPLENFFEHNMLPRPGVNQADEQTK